MVSSTGPTAEGHGPPPFTIHRGRGPRCLVRINRNHDPIIGYPRHRNRHQPLLASTQFKSEEGTPTFGNAGLSSATPRRVGGDRAGKPVKSQPAGDRD